MRNFQKLNSEKIRLAAAPLLKSFHNEIDSLSKRSKSSETAFFDIYKKSCDIADPVPTLEYYIGSMKSLQVVNMASCSCYCSCSFCLLQKLADMERETSQLRETLPESTRVEMAGRAGRVAGVEKRLEENGKSLEDFINTDTGKEKQDKMEKKKAGLEEEKVRAECQAASGVFGLGTRCSDLPGCQ